MPAPAVIPPGGGEIIGDAPDRRVEILSDLDPLHATWTRFGSLRDGASPHVHHEHTDLFYVLAGELTVKLGPQVEETVVPAGTLVRVPPLVVHGFRNGGDAELRYLNFHAPGTGFASYMRGLRDRTPVPFDQDEPPTDGGRPASEAVLTTAGELVDHDGLRVGLLADVDAIAVAEVRRGGGETSVPAAAERSLEAFYVLDGALEVAFDGAAPVRAEAGAWVLVPPGVVRTVACPEPARFLVVHAPGSGLAGVLAALS